MSWTTFEQFGKLRDAAKACKCKVKVVLTGQGKNGICFVFPDGWTIKATHFVERKESAITGWLDMLWTIRKGTI